MIGITMFSSTGYNLIKVLNRHVCESVYTIIVQCDTNNYLFSNLKNGPTDTDQLKRLGMRWSDNPVQVRTPALIYN